MKRFRYNIVGLALRLNFANYLSRNKSYRAKSTGSFIQLNEQYIRNWGKTAEYLPEVSENHLAISLFQLELERTKVTVVA